MTTPPTTTRPFTFRATSSDIKRIETIALTLRGSGKPFATRTDALKLCLKVAAADPARLLAVASE